MSSAVKNNVKKATEQAKSAEPKLVKPVAVEATGVKKAASKRTTSQTRSRSKSPKANNSASPKTPKGASPKAKPSVKTSKTKSPARTASKSPAKPKTPVKSKSPAKASKAKTPAKPKQVVAKPANKPTNKSTGKSTNKAVNKSSNKSAGKTVSKPRARSKKVPLLDMCGIGIGPARVKAVLMNEALNAVEYRAREALVEAEGLTVKLRPKNSEEADNPQTKRSAPVPIKDLDKSVRNLVALAHQSHENNLKPDYGRWRVSEGMTPSESAKYAAALDLAKNAKDEQKHSTWGTLQEFNDSYPGFYDKFEEWRRGTHPVVKKVKDENGVEVETKSVANNDNYNLHATHVVRDENGVEQTVLRFNEWTLAVALINKMQIRLSGATRNILAAFVSNLVEQYAHNGIVNCMQAGKRNAHISHAINRTDGFAERVPLHSFVASFRNFESANDWLENCAQVSLKNKEDKAAVEDGAAFTKTPPPEFEPATTTLRNFVGYAGGICRSVKLRLANEAKEAGDDKAYEAYLAINFATDLKNFCSAVVHEAILRVGAALRSTVLQYNVKTVSSEMMYYVLRVVHQLCGADYEHTESTMKASLDKFATHNETQRAKKEAKKTASGDADAEEEDAEEEDADAEEEEEVEEEVAEEEEADEEEVEAEEEEETTAEDPEIVYNDDE